ncbi:MAG TPA: hypothetical protein PLP34_07160, partial [Chitinophagaceae bacterium]|nr:hypothetical protein [Chitinophagaceae bacterium]
MKSILAFLGIVVLLSCSRKELPVPIDGDTVFHFRGTIGTDSIDYTAGINHLFLYTGFYKDTQNLMSLLSYFAPDNCTQCEPYLSIEIKDTGSTASSNALAGTIYDVLH